MKTQAENRERESLKTEIENLNNALSREVEILNQTQTDLQKQKLLIEEKVEVRKQGAINPSLDNDLNNDFLYLSAFEQTEQASREIIFDLEKQIKEKETELKNIHTLTQFNMEKEKFSPRFDSMHRKQLSVYKNLDKFLESIKEYRKEYFLISRDVAEANQKLKGDYRVIMPPVDEILTTKQSLKLFIEHKIKEAI